MCGPSYTAARVGPTWAVRLRPLPIRNGVEYPRTMESLDHATARAMLEWHLDAGADEAILDVPTDRYTLDAKPSAAAVAPATPAPAPDADPVADAEAMADAAQSLEDLAAAMQAYPHCDLRMGAMNLVFADGDAAARVMIVGEAPGREEDRAGRPFVGQAGQLLDRMLAAIELSRQANDPAASVYITNVLPWRPPGNRAPEAAEIAMFAPFLRRHIALAGPDILVVMGNTPAQALLGRAGITRLRGTWTEAAGLPVLPMVHPAYLLRNPAAKREAWADLLSLRARLNGGDGA